MAGAKGASPAAIARAERWTTGVMEHVYLGNFPSLRCEQWQGLGRSKGPPFAPPTPGFELTLAEMFPDVEEWYVFM